MCLKIYIKCLEARLEDLDKVHLVEEQEEEILKHTRAINFIIVKVKDSLPTDLE